MVQSMTEQPMNEHPAIPAFASETEEAEWWFANRETNAEWMDKAIAEENDIIGRRAGKAPAEECAGGNGFHPD